MECSDIYSDVKPIVWHLFYVQYKYEATGLAPYKVISIVYFKLGLIFLHTICLNFMKIRRSLFFIRGILCILGKLYQRKTRITTRRFARYYSQ